MTIRLLGSTSGYSEIEAPAVAGDQQFLLPGVGGTLDRLNRAGNILQVVQTVLGTTTTISSGSYTNTGLSQAITPSSTSNKVLVILGHQFSVAIASAFGANVSTKLQKESSDLRDFGGTGVGRAALSASGNIFGGTLIFSYLDSPNTTSAKTYSTQATRSGTSVGDLIIGTESFLILLEVAA